MEKQENVDKELEKRLNEINLLRQDAKELDRKADKTMLHTLAAVAVECVAMYALYNVLDCNENFMGPTFITVILTDVIGLAKAVFQYTDADIDRARADDLERNHVNF